MANGVVDELIAVLNKESELYGNILKLSSSKTDIIVKGKVSELEAVTKLEQTLILQIGKLEDEREKISERLAGQLGLEPSDATVSRLEKHLPETDKSRLRECCTRMENVLKGLRNTNGLNSKLIKNSLDYIDFSLNIFANTSSANNLYGNSGQANESKKRNFFDMRL